VTDVSTHPGIEAEYSRRRRPRRRMMSSGFSTIRNDRRPSPSSIQLPRHTLKTCQAPYEDQKSRRGRIRLTGLCPRWYPERANSIVEKGRQCLFAVLNLSRRDGVTSGEEKPCNG